MTSTVSKRLIGLTGGIGTGKTTVSNYLATVHQLPILDADIYAREAVQVGSPILQKIYQRYGEPLRLEDGSLNRKALGAIIFTNQDERQWLESQIHPYVRNCFQTQLDKLNASTVILVIPLLFEADLTQLVTEIWVVACSQQQQLQRLMERDNQGRSTSPGNLSIEQAQARINSQLPLSQKMAAADIILDNSSTPENLFGQIDRALSRLKI